MYKILPYKSYVFEYCSGGITVGQCRNPWSQQRRKGRKPLEKKKNLLEVSGQCPKSHVNSQVRILHFFILPGAGFRFVSKPLSACSAENTRVDRVMKYTAAE